jgi:hypothetical protein
MVDEHAAYISIALDFAYISVTFGALINPSIHPSHVSIPIYSWSSKGVNSNAHPYTSYKQVVDVMECGQSDATDGFRMTSERKSMR